ncbi:hypothetical protein REPUB_Repub13aG0178800 [Reevesia pubescens]
MKGGVKEDEKNEKIIRGLLKLPKNHRCINCNSPLFCNCQCSREFSHRVKSVSMATFTSEEVTGLQEGGNERAREVYFKEWDSQRQGFPDNCNIEGLRKFIKHVYVDKRYTGEKRIVDTLLTPKMFDMEDSFNSCSPKMGRFFSHRNSMPYLDICEWRSIERSGPSERIDERDSGNNHLSPKRVDREESFNSMPYLDIYEQLSVERFGSSERSDERDSGNNYGKRRNPGNGKESQKHDDRKRTLAYFEVVDDRFRDHISETTNSEDNWLANRTHHLQRRPSNRYKALDSSRPREVHSLQDILDRIPTLRLSEAVKEDGGSPSDGSVRMERTISNIETRYISGNSMEPKRLNSMGYESKNLESPVNISSDPEPASRAQQSPKSTRQPIPKPTSSPNSKNSVSIDCPTQENKLKAASKAKNLDSLVPAAKPMGNVSIKPSIGGVLTAKILTMSRISSSRGVSPASPLSNVLTSSPTSNSPNPKAAPVSAALSLTTSDGVSSSEANHVKEKRGIPQPQCSIITHIASQSTSHVPSSIQNLQSSQFVSQHIPQASSAVLLESLPSEHTLSGKMEFPEGHGNGPAVISHSGSSEHKSSGRKEFPQHPFTSTYSSAPIPSSGWQPVQAHAMGYGLQYSSAVQVPTVYQPAKLANSFDPNNGTHLLQSPMVSCYMWLKRFTMPGPQANVLEARSLLQSSNLGSPSTQWMSGQPSSYGAVPFQPSSSTSRLPLSSHMGQQVPNLPPAGCQGVEVMGNNLAFFSTLNTSQHPGGSFSTPAIQRSSFGGGNSFA